MDYGKLLSRSFEVTRKFRALWLFGFLLALFSGGTSGGGGGGAGNGGSSRGAAPNLPNIGGLDAQVGIAIGIAVACVILIAIIIGILLVTISRGALIGLVAELETNQTAPTVRRGFSIGAARFWKLFGLALLVYGPFVLIGGGLILVAVLPLLAAIPTLIANSGQIVDEMIPRLLALGLGSLALLICVAFILAVAALIVRPLFEIFQRECVIEERGVLDSIREGYRRVRANLGDVVGIYVLTIALGFGFGIAMIPVALVLVGIPAALAIAIGAATNSAAVGIIIGSVLGLPALIVLLALQTLYQVFDSTLWTEGYLAIRAKAASATAIA
ncbi:MAG: hypothetical protein HY327_07370 [Chloroflexi bacterium]|nr:hypothetical protein [Chloroflexota bacterium]